MRRILALLLLSLAAVSHAEIRTADTFQGAKKLLEKTYADYQVDRYCGCTFDSKKNVNHSSCGYDDGDNAARSKRIEIEHTVPAENLGRHFACWREGRGQPGGGRQYCLNHDPKFVQAHNDLHNLIPVVGQVNLLRSNFRFDQIPGSAKQFGQCQFKVDKQNRRAEPPDNLKGDVARITFYMRDTYGIRLSAQQTRLFEIWSRQDPVDAIELKRDRIIESIQGNSNPYVSGKAPAAPAQKPFVNVAERPEPIVAQSAAGFSCETRKTCKMMTSCEEAKFQLSQCGNTRLDGDGDGVPCNALCK